MALPRVVDGIGGVVAGIAGGAEHSVVTTVDGRVLAFGRNGYLDGEDSDGEDWTNLVVDGRLGLGAGVAEALTPTAIDGIVIGGGEGEDRTEGKEGKE